ncbi:Receptor-type guanylate cyclase gcy-13 [Blyttiomyces sp. JEL0837]|nr:Receptor-type guanylate cyclase gcy-13 [Blyttiomyces sp. JEL0837]
MQDVEAREFSQSESVSRCRNVKELKLKGLYTLLKHADEEVTIHNGNLEESRHLIMTQLFEQRTTDQRLMNEGVEQSISFERKQQMAGLVDKMSNLKRTLRYQEEARERELAFKSSIRNKRAAFQTRLQRLEQRQAAERNELSMAQYRLALTVNQIRDIEVSGTKDVHKARRMMKENEGLAQETSMKQQKEAEFLREIQLCKARQWSKLNDLEIENAEEMEDILSQQKTEEFDLLAKHAAIEVEAGLQLERQKNELDSAQLLEKAKVAKVQLIRTQRRQAQSLNKTRVVASRAREKLMLLENPIIIGEDGGDFNVMDFGESQTNSQSDISSVTDGSRGDFKDDIDGPADEADNLAHEAAVNSEANRKPTVAITDDQRVMNSLLEQGLEKIKTIVAHHRNMQIELRAQHKNDINLKNKEHRRKIADLLKEHEEEIEGIKLDQSQIMADLLETHAARKNQRSDTENSQALLGMMLPSHVLEELEKGQTPQPCQFEGVTIFFTDIFKFKSMVSIVPAEQILRILSQIYTKFDNILTKFDRLYKVESVSDTYMVAAGLHTNKGKDDPVKDAEQALKCSMEMVVAVQEMQFDNLPADVEIEIRVGAHTGSVLAGLVGTKMTRYCLFGDTVNTASRMCTTSKPSQVHLSKATYELVKDCDGLDFTEFEKTQVKGKGNMETTWLKTPTTKKVGWTAQAPVKIIESSPPSSVDANVSDDE